MTMTHAHLELITNIGGIVASVGVCGMILTGMLGMLLATLSCFHVVKSKEPPDWLFGMFFTAGFITLSGGAIVFIFGAIFGGIP